MSSTIQAFKALYAGCDQTYALAKPTGEKAPNGKLKYAYQTEYGLVTDDLVEGHMSGKGPNLCLSPLREDGTVMWAAIDIDEYHTPPKTRAVLIEKMGLPATVERSKSGGVHIVFRFKTPVDAGRVRKCMSQITRALGHPNAEIFPSRDDFSRDAEGRPEVGKKIALPYHNASSTETPCFTAQAPVTLDKFIELAQGRTCTIEDLESRFREHDSGTPAPESGTSDAESDENDNKDRGFMLPPVIPEGQRNMTMTQLAAVLWGKGVSLDALRETLLNVGSSQCYPSMEPREIEEIIKWISRKERGEILFDLTEIGSGKLFASFNETRLRYSYEAKTWFGWNGRVWTKNASAEAYMLAKNVAAVTKAEAERLAAQNSKMANAMKAFSGRLQSRAGLQNMLHMAESECAIKLGAFDPDRLLLNLGNGILDLKVMTLLPHDPGLHMTMASDVVYDPAAKCPQWLAFLDQIFESDTDLIRFMQKQTGYMLTGSIDEHCLFLYFGRGRNGKSTFINVLIALLGSYHKRIDARSLIYRRQPNGIPNDIAAIAGRRLVTSSEMGEDQSFNEALVKDLTGGDRITARYLYGEFFEFDPQAKIVMAVNHLPKILGADTGIWSRVRVIPFKVTIPADQRDKDLGRKLEAEMSGILNWALAGLRMWQAEGLEPPDSVAQAIERYREEVDPVRPFLDEMTITVEGEKIAATRLHSAYIQWARQHGADQLKQRSFGDHMGRLGYRKSRITQDSKKFTAYHGLQWIYAPTDEASDVLS